MKLSSISLQLSGIKIASLKEVEIQSCIEKSCLEKGIDPESIDDINVYINIEGTAVTAYYTCSQGSGAVRLN